MKTKNKTTSNEMLPGDIFHPGEFIKDELIARKMSQIQLAEKMNVSKSEINLIIHGHRDITPKIAVTLEKVLGIDAEFWMNLQVKYDIELVRKGAIQSIKRSHISSAQKIKLNEHIVMM